MSKNLLTTDIRRTPRQQTATDLTRRALTVTVTGTEMEMEICHWTLWTLWSHDGGINQSWLPVRSFDRFPDTAETHMWVNAHLHFILTVPLIWLGLLVLIV